MDYLNILTTCVYCGCGCPINVQVLDGEIVGVLPSREHPISRGGLCIKGWNGTSFVYHSDRLKEPLIRQGDSLVKATWPQALSVVAERLATIRAESGPGSIGFLTSAKCTNEENYLLQKLARAVIKTNNVDHCARL
jgi:formate dehydrogenase major subunit/formate dehydrogenase alpha subunit